MLEIAQHFEQAAVRFNAIVLIGLGLASVLVGLFVWLGGLGFRKALVAVVGVVGGGIFGVFIIGHNVIAALILASLATAIAIMFEKIFIPIAAAGLAVVFSFAVLTEPYIEKAGRIIPINRDQTQNQAQSLGVSQTVEVIKTYTSNFSDMTKYACSQMPAYKWVVIAVLGVIFILAGIYFRRLILALCCAALGTTLIFAGMILLLLYKAAMPISCISRRTSLYAAVFAAMIVFGTIEQLLLCRQCTGKRLITKKEANKGEEEFDKTTLDWRTR